MSRKHTYKYIQESFAAKGWVLLSKTYKSNKQKLLFECNRGHRHEKKFNSLKGGCPSCVKEDRMVPYDKINEEFMAKNCQLLSTESELKYCLSFSFISFVSSVILFP